LQASDSLLFDLAGFYHHYYDVGSVRSAVPQLFEAGGPVIEIPQRLANGAEIDSFGGEALADWRLKKTCHVQLWYSYVDFDSTQVNADTTPVPNIGNSIHHQAGLRAIGSLTETVELSSFLRYMDSVDDFSIPDYADLNLGLIWKARPDLELSLWGMNLLHDHHPEFNTQFVRLDPAEVERAFFARLTWRYNLQLGGG
jgi:hypothetical protein